ARRAALRPRRLDHHECHRRGAGDRGRDRVLPAPAHQDALARGRQRADEGHLAVMGRDPRLDLRGGDRVAGGGDCAVRDRRIQLSADGRVAAGGVDVGERSLVMTLQKTLENPMADKRWFAVHTYSGFENKVKKSLEDKIRVEGLADQFGEILIPVEHVVEMVKGEKKTSKKKMMPGYILVQMEMNDRTWHLVKNTPKVTGFVGAAQNQQPPPISDAEVQRLTTQISEGTLKPKPKVQFEEGDTVRVIDGPFSNFNGSVEEVNADKGRLKVLVSIFGRATPVELDFMQVEKTTG